MKVKRLRQIFYQWTQNFELIRRPSLRRVQDSEYLFITNLPVLMNREALDDFICICRLNGWKTEQKEQRLLLDPCWEASLRLLVHSGTESEACISLLKRHRERLTEPLVFRQALKEIESGKKGEQRFVSGLHELLSQRLREKKAFPAIELVIQEEGQ